MQYGGKYGWLWLGRPLSGIQLALTLRNHDVIDRGRRRFAEALPSFLPPEGSPLGVFFYKIWDPAS